MTRPITLPNGREVRDFGRRLSLIPAPRRASLVRMFILESDAALFCSECKTSHAEIGVCADGDSVLIFCDEEECSEGG